MTFAKKTLGLCGLASVLALAGSCSDYSYFNVDVGLRQMGDNYIDTSTQHAIVSCTIAVFIGDKQIENSTRLNENGADVCKAGTTGDNAQKKVQKDRNGTETKTLSLGVLDYSTARDGGKLKFVVTMRDDANTPIAQGWVEGSVSSGKVTGLDLVVDKCSEKDGCDIKNIK